MKSSRSERNKFKPAVTDASAERSAADSSETVAAEIAGGSEAGESTPAFTPAEKAAQNANVDDDRSTPAPPDAESVSADDDSRESILGRLLDICDDDELARDIIDIYLEETPGMLLELEAAAAENNSHEIHELGHRMKGNSANVGLVAVTEIASALETLGRQNRASAETVRLTAELRRQFDQIRELLTTIRNDLDSKQ